MGGIAQLGEHLLCTQGVRGSNPLISTIYKGENMMDAYVMIFMAYYLYAGMAVIATLIAYFWIPKAIQLVFETDEEDTEES